MSFFSILSDQLTAQSNIVVHTKKKQTIFGENHADQVPTVSHIAFYKCQLVLTPDHTLVLLVPRPLMWLRDIGPSFKNFNLLKWTLGSVYGYELQFATTKTITLSSISRWF